LTALLIARAGDELAIRYSFELDELHLACTKYAMEAEVQKIIRQPKEVEPLEVDDIVDFVDCKLSAADQHLVVDKWIYTAIRQELGVNENG